MEPSNIHLIVNIYANIANICFHYMIYFYIDCIFILYIPHELALNRIGYVLNTTKRVLSQAQHDEI